MDSARWQEMEEIFHQAAQLSAPQRQHYLKRACARESALQDEIQSLLASLEGDPEFLQDSAFGVGLRVLAEAESRRVALGQRIKDAD